MPSHGVMKRALWNRSKDAVATQLSSPTTQQDRSESAEESPNKRRY
jgi:hypothetical protein